MISVKRPTQSTALSRTFHTMPRRPPGRSTRAISGCAAGENQCHACATSTASTLASGSGTDSAEPASACAPGTVCARRSRIASDGSTATTSRPRATRRSVSLPVPAARSRTLRAPVGRSQSTAASGYEGRVEAYWAAPSSNDAARSAREPGSGKSPALMPRRCQTAPSRVDPYTRTRGPRRSHLVAVAASGNVLGRWDLHGREPGDESRLVVRASRPGMVTPLGYGVIGSTSDSGSLSLGSSPGTPAKSSGSGSGGQDRAKHEVEFSTEKRTGNGTKL